MRILVSNPDTIGDLVLRQPLFAAMIDAGHSLALVVRPEVAPLARHVAPGAALIVLSDEVYRDQLDNHWSAFASVVSAAIAFAPDLLVVAPYQWTRFDELLADALRAANAGIRVAGMNGHVWPGDPMSAGAVPADRLTLDLVADVPLDLPEADKNRRLAQVIGCQHASDTPTISADGAAIDSARAALASHGIEPGGFWIACVGGTAHVSIKAWQTEHWAEALTHWATQYGRRFVFVGLPAEREAADAVRLAMGDAGDRTLFLTTDTIDALIATISLSAGYVGNDTGPMHLAAACGKPVVAVFGGGHWPRFIPKSPLGVAITLGVPCAGCGWACAFETSHCVKEIPPSAVIAAINDLEAGRLSGMERRTLSPDAVLRDRMIAEGAQRVWKISRIASAVANERAAELETVASANQLRSERDQSIAELATVRAQAIEATGRLEAAVEANAKLSQESAGLVQQLQDRERSVISIREDCELLRRAAEESRARADAADRRTADEAEARREEVFALKRSAGFESELKTRRDEVEGLKQQVATLQKELGAARARLSGSAESTDESRVRKSWRERLVESYCGTRHYSPRSLPAPMPRILIVVRILHDRSDADVQATLDSIIAQQYSHLELIVAVEPNRIASGDSLSDASIELSGLRSRPVLQAYVDHAAAILPIGHRPFGAVASAFGQTEAEVIAWIDAGQTYEPGALLRLGQTFRDHTFAFAVAMEQTERTAGWRFARPRVRLDVDSLRNPAHPFSNAHVAFLRSAYNQLGPLDPDKGHAAGWDLLIRFARRFGIRHGKGQSICCQSTSGLVVSEQVKTDLSAASSAFEATFGGLGRARCAMLHHAGTVRVIFRRTLQWRRRSFITDAVAAPAETFAAESNGLQSVPVSPVTHQPPERLLFSSRDVLSPDPAVYRVYLDRQGDVAVCAPSADKLTLTRHFDARLAVAGTPSQAAADPESSPFRGYCGSAFWRWMLSVPSPYWRLLGESPGVDPPAARLARLATTAFALNDSAVRALVVGCLDGQILEDLKKQVSWRLTGTETHAESAATAVGKGHRVLACSPQQVFMTLPDGEMFDVILIPAMLEHWLDPAWVLRRLSRVLSPKGAIVVRTPNLDSKLIDLFGPTWWHWQTPYHHNLFGRRGLRSLATSADLCVTKLTTVTDAYSAAASVQLNQLGLSGLIPEGTSFPPAVSSAGAKLAGWARTVWDPIGRGDEIWAVMRPL